MLSPPCCAFSQLNQMWNFPKMDPVAVASCIEEGLIHLQLAVTCAMAQHRQGRFWALEHPASAKSWSDKCLRDLCMLDNVRTITFDQCQLGLISPGGSPLRKRTRIATNSNILAEKLCGKLCSGEHIHMRVTGSEFNVVLSRHAQKYPPGLVAAIAEAAVGHVLSGS